jgi:hypothetical protein
VLSTLYLPFLGAGGEGGQGSGSSSINELCSACATILVQAQLIDATRPFPFPRPQEKGLATRGRWIGLCNAMVCLYGPNILAVSETSRHIAERKRIKRLSQSRRVDVKGKESSSSGVQKKSRLESTVWFSSTLQRYGVAAAVGLPNCYCIHVYSHS